jgi:hypothetical protein
MAKKSSFNEPPKPLKLSHWEVRKIKRQGRKDAKTTQGLKDFTKTQAVNVFEAESQAGQIGINSWLLTHTAPYASGNARMHSEAGLVCTRIGKAKAFSPSTGREKKYAAMRLAVLEQEMSDLRAQFDSNREFCRATVRKAEEILPLWEQLYRMKCAIYYRARAGKSGTIIDANSAEIPPFHNIELREIEATEDEFRYKEGDC